MDVDETPGSGGSTPLQDEPSYEYSFDEGTLEVDLGFPQEGDPGFGNENESAQVLVGEEAHYDGSEQPADSEEYASDGEDNVPSPVGSPISPASPAGSDGPRSPAGSMEGPQSPPDSMEDQGPASPVDYMEGPTSPVSSTGSMKGPRSPPSPAGSMEAPQSPDLEDETQPPESYPAPASPAESMEGPQSPDLEDETQPPESLVETPASPEDIEATAYSGDEGPLSPKSPSGSVEGPQSPASPSGSMEGPKSPASENMDGPRSPVSPSGSMEGPRSPTGSAEGPASPTGSAEGPMSPQSPSGSVEGPKSPASPSGSVGDPRSPSGSGPQSQVKSSSPARSRSRSGSPARSRSRSGSPARSRSRSGSPARSRSRSGSPARSRSRSGSPARSRSRSGSPARSRSRSGSPTRRRSQSGSPARRRSRSGSPARSRSRSGSPARNRSPARSGSARGSPAGSASPDSFHGFDSGDEASATKSARKKGSDVESDKEDEAKGKESDDDNESDKGSAVGELIADIFGSSDEEEEFEGFGEADVEAPVQNKDKKKIRALDSDDEAEPGTADTGGEQVLPELSDDENEEVERGEDFVSDFDLMMVKKKDEASKHRRKRKEGDIINDNDDLIADMIVKMKQAAEGDRDLNHKRQPAIKKLKYLPDVLSQLKKADLHGAFLDCGVLSAMTEWLAPLPDKSLPHLQIRECFLRMLQEFPSISSEGLKSSGVGKAVMYLYKHPKETKENKDKCGKLINEWSRPIFNLTSNYKLLSKEEREQRDYEQIPKRRRISSEGMTPRAGIDNAMAGEQKALRPGDKGFVNRARVPMPSHKDYVVRPKWKVEEMLKPSGKKEITLYEKHVRKFQEKKKNKKAQRAIGISIEGKNMAL